MTNPILTRREALALGAIASLPIITGCDRRDVANATTDAMIAIGGVVLLIPHWLGKFVGVALVSGGSAIKIYFACSDLSQKEVEIELTEEQKHKIQKAIAEGQKFTITDPKGNKQSVAPNK